MKRDNGYLIGNQHAANTGPNKTSFKKGQPPWNKGKKGIHLSPKTEFKKGRKSINWAEVGTKTIRTEKGGKKRRWIKVDEPNVWIEYAKWVWMQQNGAIPHGLLIHHIDKNTLNDKEDNLSLVNRATHMNLHRNELRG